VASTPSLEERLIGQTLAGRYRIDAVQASGAFGTVFRARQFFCGQFVRPVAVKVSRQSGLSEATAAQAFGDAIVLARILAGGDHEGRRHLVQIYDMGLLPEHGGRAFLAMEYVDGLPLLSHLHAAGKFSVATGLRLVKQICRALALVHEQGAVHRDLSADNILVDRRGIVRVVDFGLAAYADPGLGFAPGSLGKFIYMAPETLRGRSTAASDVYGLGLLMYELFTGGGPHLAASWSLEDSDNRRDENHRLKTSLRFLPPSAAQNEIRNDYRWLDGLILRCLENEPERRYADAGRLLAAIEAGERGEELPPPSSGIPTAGNASVPPAAADADPDEALFREVRRLLAGKAYDQAIDRLDVHRPAEWAVVDLRGARTLRALGQAYLGRNDLRSARECLEQLKTAQGERAVLPKADFAAALSDLCKCYRALGLADAARECQEEVKRLP
jgi:serine/threonine protein kinase